MIEDAKTYILTEVSLYIDEMLSSLDSLKPSPSLQPVCEQLLSATFLQMIGAIEQKVYNVKWYLGFSDHSLRYGIQKDFSKQSTSSKELSSVYSLLEKKINNKSSSLISKDIWGDDEKLQQAYQTVYDMFSTSNIIEYTNCDFIEYEKNYLLCFFSKWEGACAKRSRTTKRASKTRLSRNIANFEEYYKFLEKKINGELSNSDSVIGGKNTSDKKISFLKVYYERMMNHRHSIAHNFNSLRHDTPLIHELSSYIHRFDNYYYRYMICIYLDIKIQDAFSKLLTLHSKLLA